MKRQSKLVSMLVCLVIAAALILTACQPQEVQLPKAAENYDDADVYTEGKFTTVWEAVGSKIGIEDVTTDATNKWQAFATVDGKKYELGMDFLSRAMVYSTSVTDESTAAGFNTEEKIYNEWFKLYLLRWNHLLPEVPLYSNTYYDAYNIQKIQKGTLKTAPFWGVADAILGVQAVEGAANGTLIIGDSTQLSGRFRNASYKASSPMASDLDVVNLTSAYSTVVTTPEGLYEWEDAAVAAHEEKVETDGSKTFTITIKSGLKFSDGTEITAQNYLVALLATSTDVYAQVAGSNQGGLLYKGWEEFSLYDGTNNGEEIEGVTASKYFSGARLLDTYKFAITVAAENLPYYYELTYASLSPQPLSLYLPEGASIKDDGQGAYIDGDFYAAKDDSYTWADTINANMLDNWQASKIPYSGPYVVSNWDSTSGIATLTKNPEFKGDSRGNAVFNTISYVKVVAETQTQQFQTGQVDILAGITGADQTEEILKLCQDNPTKFATNDYPRAGYGKLGFRSDFGPTMFLEVRHAIAYTIDRDNFNTSFTGGHGVTVHGPYFPDMEAYKANQTTFEQQLNIYATSTESAVAELKAGGWIYNGDGSAYQDGSGQVRYKKLAANEQTEYNLKFHSQDNKYYTTVVEKENGEKEFYMPLVINWYGTTDNVFSDLLISQWASSQSLKTVGMVVCYTLGDMATMLYSEYYQMSSEGWNGDAVYGAFNFATGFNSTIYDYSYNWDPQPQYFNVPGYSICYLKDAADYVWLTE